MCLNTERFFFVFCLPISLSHTLSATFTIPYEHNIYTKRITRRNKFKFMTKKSKSIFSGPKKVAMQCDIWGNPNHEKIRRSFFYYFSFSSYLCFLSERYNLKKRYFFLFFGCPILYIEKFMLCSAPTKNVIIQPSQGYFIRFVRIFIGK